MSRGAAVDIVVSEEKKLEGLAVIESDGGVATLGSGRGTRHSIHTHVRDDARRTPTLKHGCNEHLADCGVHRHERSRWTLDNGSRSKRAQPRPTLSWHSTVVRGCWAYVVWPVSALMVLVTSFTRQDTLYSIYSNIHSKRNRHPDHCHVQGSRAPLQTRRLLHSQTYGMAPSWLC